MNLIQTWMIITFDQHHTFFELKNHVFINVVWSESDKKKYQISKSSKLFLLREKSFSIKWKMSDLTYKLKFSASWKIHLIISVIYLEQTYDESSIFDHQSSSSVIVNKHKKYQIEKILKYQINEKEDQLLIKWVEYDELI